MVSIKCKVCDTGTLSHKKKYRMSGVVVFIGYILLIPSVLGVLLGVAGAVFAGSSGEDVMASTRASARTNLEAESVPTATIDKLLRRTPLVASDTSSLSSQQRLAVRVADMTLSSSLAGAGVGTALAGGFFLAIAVASLVGGLLGWLLIMKKRVLECDTCGSVLAAS